MTQTEMQLTQIAKDCRAAFERCHTQDADLFGRSLLDLCADNMPDVSLSNLKAAILISGIYALANARIRAQIDAYRGMHA